MKKRDQICHKGGGRADHVDTSLRGGGEDKEKDKEKDKENEKKEVEKAIL